MESKVDTVIDLSLYIDSISDLVPSIFLLTFSVPGSYTFFDVLMSYKVCFLKIYQCMDC